MRIWLITIIAAAPLLVSSATPLAAQEDPAGYAAGLDDAQSSGDIYGTDAPAPSWADPASGLSGNAAWDAEQQRQQQWRRSYRQGYDEGVRQNEAACAFDLSIAPCP